MIYSEILRLADMQLEREGELNSKHYLSLLFDRAERIVKYLRICERNKKVMQSRYGKHSEYRQNLIKKFEDVVSINE